VTAPVNHALARPAEERVLTDDGLFRACGLVCTAAGIELPARLRVRQQPESVAAIAAAAGVRTRRIALRPGWWRQSAEPLLGFAGDRPVALLPGRLGRHLLVDPVGGRRVRMTERVNARLAPTAYAFYRPLPGRPLSGRDLFLLALGRTRSDIAALLAAGAAGGALALAAPVAATTIFGQIVPTDDRLALVGLALALIAVALAVAVLQIGRGLAIQRVQTRVGVSVQAALWDRLLRLPPRFFRAYTAGELATRSLGIERMRQLLGAATVELFISAGFSLVSFALLFVYDPALAAVAAAAVFCLLVVQTLGAWRQLPGQRSAWASETRVAGLLSQILSAIGKLRVAGAEERAFGRWAEEFTRQRRFTRQAVRVGNRAAAFTLAAPLLGELLIFAAASSPGHGLSTARFVGFNAAFMQVLVAFVALGPALAAVVGAIPLVEAAQPILRAVPETARAGADPGELAGEIELSQVSFRYHPHGPLAVDDVSLRISPGELIAIVGPSGSGKSTLIRLLLGFEQPQQGTVLFDGRDLRALDVEGVRKQIGAVLQNGGPLPTDIFTNIVGASGANMEDAWRAARVVGLAELVERLPMGMHTIVPEQGSTFSGGERQRLMLARAVVRRPRIMLLDEATSAIDARAEEEIARSLSTIAATRVVVAHRLTTIAGADRIYLMLGGRIAASGTYDELLERSDAFAELAERQLL